MCLLLSPGHHLDQHPGTDCALWPVQLPRKLPGQEGRGAISRGFSALLPDAPALQLCRERRQGLPTLLHPSRACPQCHTDHNSTRHSGGRPGCWDPARSALEEVEVQGRRSKRPLDLHHLQLCPAATFSPLRCLLQAGVPSEERSALPRSWSLQPLPQHCSNFPLEQKMYPKSLLCTPLLWECPTPNGLVPLFGSNDPRCALGLDAHSSGFLRTGNCFWRGLQVAHWL